MLLSKYLQRGQRETFARSIGVTPDTLSSYASGARVPSYKTAYRISKATDGQVSIEELIPLDEPYSVRVRFRAGDPVLSQDEIRRRTLRLAAAESAA